MDFSICKANAAYFVDQAMTASPKRAASLYDCAAQKLQNVLDKLPKRSYPESGVAELVIETASLRQTASQRYHGVGDDFSAGLELSRGARCLESYARHLIENEPPEAPVPKENLLQLFKEALRFRNSAAAFFRSSTESSLNLAFELSYRSRTMSFLRRHCPEYNTPETLDQMIQDLSESSPIFEDRREYNEAYFGYWHLAMSLMDKGCSDPSFYLPAVFSVYKAAEMSEMGRLEPIYIPKLYRIAASAYRQLADATNDQYADLYRKQALEMALKAIEAGDKADGITAPL